MTRILYIEDEQAILEEVLEWLQFEGYEAIGAANGRAGLDSARREQPDLILCDIALPEMDGFRVLHEVRSDPITVGTPFIFLTASVDHESLRQGMDMGADDYLTKPFDRSTLLHAVQARLQKKAMQETQARQQIELLTNLLEEERERRLLKSRVVAMFSHDFRNPLTAILSSTSLLREVGDQMSPERRVLHLDRIEGSVRQLLDMLNDMLTVAELESGSFEFSPEPVDVVGFTNAIVERFRFTVGATRNLNVAYDFQDLAEIDLKLYNQLLSNLLSNAVKYSAAGSAIEVALTGTDDQLVITVSDQGIGIPAEALDRIFAPFQRAANAKEVQGSGLGLTIVKQAVDLHRGSIEVMSKVGQGTAVVVRLPIRQSQPVAAGTAPPER